MIHIKNENIENLIVGVPSGHTHTRAYLKVSGREMLINEATLAAIVRAYVDIKTHPQKTGVELKSVFSEKRKTGFARMQLIETERSGEDVSSEISVIVEKVRNGEKEDDAL